MVSTVFLTAMARAEGLKEGQWSMTMKTKMEGNPEMAEAMKQMENMPPEAKAMMQQMQGKMGVQMGSNGEGMTMTVTQCITNQNPVPKDSKMPKDCTETHEIKGNTVNFHTTCNNKNMQMDSTGHVTYTGDSMNGQIKSHQTTHGKTTDATIDLSGKYLGPCS